MPRPKMEKYASKTLRSKGIKHGVRNVERSHFIDDEGDFNEEGCHWREDRKHFQNPCLQVVANVLVWMRCLPADPEDMLKLKNWLLWMQWAALLCDVAGAIVAVVTFSDVTYCCGDPILDAAGTIPWKQVIRGLTYAYLVMVFLEIYPAVRKGFPFNIVNPLVGFLVTIAMFFYDTEFQALLMWAVETASIVFEFILYRLKVRQIENNKVEIVEVGRKTKKLRKLREGEDPDAPVREQKEMRQKYYQLKQEQATDHTLLWYLGAGCYVNIVLSLIILTLIIVMGQSGGLCVNDFGIPNPFDLNQIGRCPLCPDASEYCEICTDETSQCYYPYG